MGCHTRFYRRVQDSEYIYILDYLKNEANSRLKELENPEDWMIKVSKDEINKFKDFLNTVDPRKVEIWYNLNELIRNTATVRTIEYNKNQNKIEDIKSLIYHILISPFAITNRITSLDLIYDEFNDEFYIACETFNFIEKELCNEEWLKYLETVDDPSDFFRSTEYDHWICSKEQLKNELLKDDYYMYRSNKEQSKKLNNYDRLQIENLWDKMIELYGDIKIKFS